MLKAFWGAVMVTVLAACVVRVEKSTSTEDTGPAKTSKTDGTPNTKVIRGDDSTPEEVTVQAHFRDDASPISVSDRGRTVTILNINVVAEAAVPQVNDQIVTGKAKSMNVQSPNLEGCEAAKLDLYTIAGPISNSVLMMSAEEPNGKTDCVKFLTAVSAAGVTLEYTDVPFLNSPSRLIKKVTVTILPKK